MKTSPTDKELADAVRNAVQHLNSVANTATRAGLQVTYDTVEHREISRPVKLLILSPIIMKQV